jgi:hypothetical protein
MATPPINVVGSFVVRAPFTTAPGAIYKCESIRGFEALDSEGVDIYDAFYKPFGLTEEQYNNDRINSIDIVTLMSLTAATIVLPSSYIVSFPTAEVIPYQHHFLVFDLGILNEDFDLKGVADYCKQALDASIGINVAYRTVTHPITEFIDPSRHEQLMRARIANQQIPDSHYKQNQILKTTERALRQQISILETELLKYIK